MRRRSGKIFGPFEIDPIIDMLGKGELLGNEDVSPDGEENWVPIGSIPAFADAMRSLMDAPVKTPDPTAAPAVAPSVKTYVRRMAESKVVSGSSSHRRWLPLIAGAAGLLVILGVGAGAGFTRHGVFFYKVLRGRSPNRPAAKWLQQARVALAEDHFESTRRAVELVEQAIKLDRDDPEAKGLYAQTVAAWMRRGGAPMELISRAEAYVQELMTDDASQPDTIKARVAMDLAAGKTTAAGLLNTLEKLGQRPTPDEEALWLLGQTAAARKDWKSAARWHGAIRAVGPGAARAAHGMAVILVVQGDTAGARAFYEKALAQDSKHLTSALELAALMEKSGDAAAAETTVRGALVNGAVTLSAEERARGRVLLADLLIRYRGADGQNRLKEAEWNFEEAVKEAPGYLPARLAYARFLWRRGASDRAMSMLQPVEARSATEVEFAALYGPALAANGRVLDAVNVVESALAKSPSSARLLFAKGYIAEQRGKRDEARGLYERAVAADQEDWESHLALGRMALRSGLLDRAEAALKLAAEKGSREPEPRVGLGDWKLMLGDQASAEAQYHEALKLDPDHAAGHLGLARVFFARGDDAAARSALEKAVQLDPRLVSAQVTLGELLWRAKDLEGAKKAFERAGSLEPQNAVARARLGAVELELGQVDAAVNDLLAASNLDLSLPDVHYWLGRALLAKNETSPAMEHLKRACELKPDQADYHLYLGMAQERAHALLEAVEEYQLAIAKDPQSLEGYERLGHLYYGQNRCEEALTVYEKALKQVPEAQRFRVAIGECKQKMGKHSEAMTWYRQVLKADPSQVGLYYKIGRTVHESIGMRQALPWYERASREDAANPMPHYYLGFYYKERGLREKAIQEFRAYLKAKPDAEDRKDVEREIEDLGN